MTTKRTSVPIGQESMFGTHQIDNVKFLEALKVEKKRYIEAKASGKPPPTLSNYVAKTIGAICEGLSLRKNYRYYTYRDDMVATAIINCVKYWHNFDPERFDNPHAYFSFIASKSFNRFIKGEKKMQYIKYCSVQNLVTEMELTHESGAFREFLETYLRDQSKVKDSFDAELSEKGTEEDP